jgi:hypothetical protein
MFVSKTSLPERKNGVATSTLVLMLVLNWKNAVLEYYCFLYLSFCFPSLLFACLSFTQIPLLPCLLHPVVHLFIDSRPILLSLPLPFSFFHSAFSDADHKANGNTYRIANIHANCHADRNADCHADSYADCHADSYADCHADSYSDCHAYSNAVHNANCRADCYSDSHAYTRADHNADCHANCHSDCIALPWAEPEPH